VGGRFRECRSKAEMHRHLYMEWILIFNKKPLDRIYRIFIFFYFQFPEETGNTQSAFSGN
jgi:hypothetical protein